MSAALAPLTAALAAIESGELVLLVVSCVLTLLSAALAAFECGYVFRKISLEQRRNKLYFLITLFPVSGVAFACPTSRSR